MKIADIRKLLLNKKISHYDGFSGTHNWFTIGHVKKKEGHICAYKEKGARYGIWLTTEQFNQLIEKGEYSERGEIERCPYSHTWKLWD